MRGYKLVLVTAVVSLALQAAASGAQIGTASATKNQVDGIVGGTTRQLSTGSQVNSNEVIRTGTASVGEFVFLDSTKLSVGPISEVRLDKFVYNPGGNSSVVVNATHGAFRFVTGVLDKRAYAIRTPYGTIGVRGTILEITVLQCTGQPQCGLSVKVVDGGATVTTSKGQVINVEAGMMVTVSPQGVVTGPVPAPTSILDFASLEEGTTVVVDLPPAAIAGLVGLVALVPILTHHKSTTPPTSP